MIMLLFMTKQKELLGFYYKNITVNRYHYLL